MQQLGVNTIRVYNLSPTLDHDQCVSIFNAVSVAAAAARLRLATKVASNGLLKLMVS